MTKMTAKIIVLFGKPTDAQAFDNQNSEEQDPIAKKKPGARKYTVQKILSPPRGEPAYYQIVELHSDSMESLKRATSSPAGSDSTSHGAKMATGGMTIMFAESKEAL